VRVAAHTPPLVARKAAMGSRAERLVWVDLEVLWVSLQECEGGGGV